MFLSLHPVVGDVQMNMRISGLRLGAPKIPATIERALYVAEDSSKFELIIRRFQLEKVLLRRKISMLTCQIKEPRNQVAFFVLLTASSEAWECSFLLFSICRKLSALD